MDSLHQVCIPDAISFKLWVKEEYYGDDVIAGTGMNHLRFIKPVFPNDVLYCQVKVLQKKVLKNNTGILTVELATFNQKDEKVFKGELSALLKR